MFFAQFPLVFNHIRSISFTFHHSSNAVSPHTPHRTVAKNVVRFSPLEPLPVLAERVSLLSLSPIQVIQTPIHRRLQLKIYGAIKQYISPLPGGPCGESHPLFLLFFSPYHNSLDFWIPLRYGVCTNKERREVHGADRRVRKSLAGQGFSSLFDESIHTV